MTRNRLAVGAPVRIGVVGLGFGRCHADVLAREDGVKLAAVADVDPERQGIELASYARRLGARAYRDGRQLIDREDLDAVVLAVPPRHRAVLIAAAVEHGVDMFVEKPFATNLAHAAELAAFCEPCSDRVMLDLCVRHLPAVARLRELLTSSLGPALVVNADLMLPRDDVPAWVWNPANGNGVINENACHLLDVLCVLLGEPLSVFAAGADYLGHGLEDGVAIVVRFAAGGVGLLSAGCLGAAAMATPASLSVYAARGHARLHGRDHMVSVLDWATPDGASAIHERWESLPRGEIAAPALRHFIGCVRSGNAPEPGIDAGLRVLEIAMATRRSLERGSPVALGAHRDPHRPSDMPIEPRAPRGGTQAA